MRVQEITDGQIENARIVLENHVVRPLTLEGAFESGLFCICSQATPFEIASRFVYALRETSHSKEMDARQKYSKLDVLIDKDKVNAAALKIGWRFAYKKRFDEFIDYFKRLDGNWPEMVRDAGVEERERFVNDVKWLSNKTFSFWSICLGGTNLLALDVYVMKGLKDLGIDIKDDFVYPVARNIGSQRVRKTPRNREYLIIEREARDFFERDERFLLGDGKVNMALIDAVLWWARANRDTQNQGYLFGNGNMSWLYMPYAN